MQTIFAGSQGSSNFTYQKTFLQQVVTSATLTSIPDPNALCRRNFVTEFRYGCLSSVWPDWAFLKNVLGGKFSFKSSQNICWLLGYSKNITFWIKTVVTNFWATFKITGLLCILFFKKKMGHSRPLFIYFRLFNTVDNKQMFNKILPMTGVEPRTSGIKSTALPNKPQPLPYLLCILTSFVSSIALIDVGKIKYLRIAMKKSS